MRPSVQKKLPWLYAGDESQRRSSRFQICLLLSFQCFPLGHLPSNCSSTLGDFGAKPHAGLVQIDVDHHLLGRRLRFQEVVPLPGRNGLGNRSRVHPGIVLGSQKPAQQPRKWLNFGARKTAPFKKTTVGVVHFWRPETGHQKRTTKMGPGSKISCPQCQIFGLRPEDLQGQPVALFEAPLHHLSLIHI